ncbi:hypothetical protein CR513_60418, partial [Mucuna pruriens]
KEKVSLITSPKIYLPPIPFPQRLVRPKLNKQFAKFLDMIKQEMATYAKFLKNSLANRRKVDERETMTLVYKKLSSKLKNSSSFSILCLIRGTKFEKALCSGLMLDLGKLKPITMSIQLLDKSLKYLVRHELD